jgi:hypothetical protein
MSKRNSEGEVLANIFAVKLAQSQSQLATLLGGAPQPELQIGNLNETNNDEDLRRDYVDDEAYVPTLFKYSQTPNAMKLRCRSPNTKRHRGWIIHPSNPRVY